MLIKVYLTELDREEVGAKMPKTTKIFKNVTIKQFLFIIVLSIPVAILIPNNIAMDIANYISGFIIFERLGEGADFIGYLIFYAVQLIQFFLVVLFLAWLFMRFKKK